MFEFKTSGSEIGFQTLLIYYIILTAIYLVFFRVKKFDLLTLIIFIGFNQAFFNFAGDLATYGYKIIIFGLVLKFYFSGHSLKKSHMDVLFTFGLIIFAIVIILGFIINKQPLLLSSAQFTRLVTPFLFYFGLKRQRYSHAEFDYYAHLIIKLVKFQLIFTVVKYFIIGMRENIVGSIVNAGGGAAVFITILGAIIIWIEADEKISRNTLLLFLFLTLIPIVSNKRAIWFVYPILIAAMFLKNRRVLFIKRFSYIVILIPLFIYLGLRINPSLNSEKKIWGKFDPGYAYDYITYYSVGSKYEQRGRQGSNQILIREIVKHPYSSNNLLGYGADMIKTKSYSEFYFQKFELSSQLLSGIHHFVIAFGYLPAIMYMFIIILLIVQIHNFYHRAILLLLFLWDFTQYSNVILQSSILSFMFMFILFYWKYEKIDQNVVKRKIIY